MRSTQARVALVVGTIAAVVILFIVLSGDDDNDSSTTSVSTTNTSTAATGDSASQTGEAQAAKPAVVVVEDGEPRGGVKRLTFATDDRVRLVVRSDVADEVHVHGYDLAKDVSAGGSVKFDFKADIEGVFEVELEERGEQIASLRVGPS